ncbi:MAG: response regulator [Acidobacteria bacterium]|nr:response regulator [Acidobacteriota bacterium]
MRFLGLIFGALVAWAEGSSIQAIRASVEAQTGATGPADLICTVTMGTGYLQMGREEFYCQDSGGGISVVTAGQETLEAGARIRITGRFRYAAKDDEPQIEAERIERLKPVGPLAPQEASLPDVVAGKYRGMLVSTIGQVTVVAPVGEERDILFIRDMSGAEMRVYGRHPSGTPSTFAHLQPKPGDWITVTGISLPREERRYQIRLRSPADLRRTPPEVLFWPRAFWAAAVAFALAGFFAFWVVTLRRTVARKTAEVRILLEKAEESSRLKSEFLANMSHEIRTPLHGVLGLQRLLLDGKIQGEDRRHLELAQDSAQTLMNLLNDILDFSKVEANKLELSPVVFDPRHLVESVVSLFAPAAGEKGLRIDWQSGDSIPSWVSADELRLRQILTNLISNAVKFTEAGGVRIDVGMQNPNQLLISVTDTGPGIPYGAHLRIFEPFRQADGSSSRKHGGTGLGLAISARLAGALGGRLWLENSSSNGSCFRFTVDVAPAEKPSEIISIQPSPARPLSILVVEDNRVNQKLILKMLARAGHLTSLANNGREALEQIANSSFDLILMDVQMPEMDGVETAFRIRHMENLSGAPRMPIIGLTAHAMKGDRERFLAAGMDDYLPKPVSFETLNAALAKAVAAPTE